MRLNQLLIAVVIAVFGGMPLLSTNAQLAMVEDAKKKDNPATCADGYGRSLTLPDIDRFGKSSPESRAFWIAHSSCFGETSGAVSSAVLTAMCSPEQDLVLRLTTPEQMLADVPELEDWVVCLVSVAVDGHEPVALRAEDFELIRNGGNAVSPSERIVPFIPAELDITGPRFVGDGELVFGLLAFDVDEGWVNSHLLLRWWETGDVIIVDRTDLAPVQLLAGNKDVLP